MINTERFANLLISAGWVPRGDAQYEKLDELLISELDQKTLDSLKMDINALQSIQDILSEDCARLRCELDNANNIIR